MVGWFYGMSTLAGLLNVEVIFSVLSLSCEIYDLITAYRHFFKMTFDLFWMPVGAVDIPLPLMKTCRQTEMIIGELRTLIVIHTLVKDHQIKNLKEWNDNNSKLAQK